MRLARTMQKGLGACRSGFPRRTWPRRMPQTARRMSPYADRRTGDAAAVCACPTAPPINQSSASFPLCAVSRPAAHEPGPRTSVRGCDSTLAPALWATGRTKGTARPGTDDSERQSCAQSTRRGRPLGRARGACGRAGWNAESPCRAGRGIGRAKKSFS